MARHHVGQHTPVPAATLPTPPRRQTAPTARTPCSAAVRHRCPTSPAAAATAGADPTPRPPRQTPAANSGKRLVQLPAHPQPLRALAGKHEHRLARPNGHAPPSLPRPAHRWPAPASLPSDGRGPRRPPRPDGRTPHVSSPTTKPHRQGCRSGIAGHVREQPPGLICQRLLRAGGQHPRRRARLAVAPQRFRASATGGCSMITCAFVPLIPNDDTPARRGPSPARPRPRFRQQRHRARRPIHVRRRHIHVQRLRHHPVLDRLHHLDHPGHSRGGRRVTDVGFDRAQPQRPIRRPILAIGRQQRLRLNRIPEHGPRAMPLDHVDIRRRQPGAGQRRADDPLLGRPVRVRSTRWRRRPD